MSSSSSPSSPRSSPVSPTNVPGTDSYFTSSGDVDRMESIVEHVESPHHPGHPHSRTQSVPTISFQSGFSGAQKPAGRRRANSGFRLRDSSPPPASRFQHHVSFDNFAGVEPTEKNTLSFTLNAKHKGYQYKRGSRTFMVGIDENLYSNIALQWMLEELVDDGDEIVCLRVIDKDSKITSDRNLERKQYQKDAKDLLTRIQEKNDENRAISIALEFAVGKLHATFQKMIQLYEPAMLVVGTRGRSLGGIQGLLNNRNSFSKWCLQYSPIPVVVVRPTEKREKKRKKRDADPARQDYARILKDSGVQEHETGFMSKNGELEVTNTPNEEAHAVAAALGLPARFDPTIKPFQFEGGTPLRIVESARSDGTGRTSISQGSESPESRPRSPETAKEFSKPANTESPEDSGEQSSEEEGEFDVVSGDQLLKDHAPEVEKRKRLHDMEVGEAAALAAGRKLSIGSVDSTASRASTGGATLAVSDADEEE